MSSLPKLFLGSQSQQQAIYKFVHPFLTTYAPLYMPHTLINQTQKLQISPIILAKSMLECS